jgi:hypothetical protein
MAFEYAYSTNGSDVLPSKNFKLNSTYATTAKKGDVVALNPSQELVKAGATNTEVLGVLEATVFEGLLNTPKEGQVKLSGEAIYKTPFTGTTPVVGTAYPINASQVLNGSGSGTGSIYKVIDVKGSNAYVQITATTFE